MKLLLRNIFIILIPLFACELLLHTPRVITALYAQQPNAEWADGMIGKNKWKETILMGSSLVREGIDPKVLQKGLVKHGIKTTVGSIAVPSDRLSNDFFTFNRIMTTCTVCPKNIVIGIQDLALKKADSSNSNKATEDQTYARIKQNYLFDKNSDLALYQAAQVDPIFKQYYQQITKESLFRTYYFREYIMNYGTQNLASIFHSDYSGQQALMKTQVLDDPGYGFWPYTERLSDTTPKNSINNYKSYLGKYTIGGGETVFLTQLLTLAKQKHVHVYLVLTPETNYYTSTFAKETTMLRNYIKTVGNKYTTPVIDAIDFMPRDYNDYADTNHLNKDGASKFSTYLAEELSKLHAMNSK